MYNESMSASSTDMSSNNSSVSGKNQGHQPKLFTAKVAEVEEDEKLNVVTAYIMKENEYMETELHQGGVEGDNSIVHTQQYNQLERTSATAATVSTPGGNEHVILPHTTETSTSQCDQNQPNTPIASKLTETTIQDDAESDSVVLSLGKYPRNSSCKEENKNANNNKEHDTLEVEEDEKLNVVTSYIMKENEYMQTELHQGGAEGDNSIVHTQQYNQLERTSATAATVSTPGGNEHIILPHTAETSTSQCDQNQAYTPVASKLTETTIQDDAEPDSVFLSLGKYPRNSSCKEASKNANNNKEHDTLDKKLALGLEFKVDTFYSELKSNFNSRKRIEQGENTEKEEDNRRLKIPRSGEDKNFNQSPAELAKVITVRMPCNTPVTGDGCQWKKYGQKAAKGSPFPRSYYRCCVTSTCEAKKQVQICPTDLSTLITTYEGVHNHPLTAISTNVAPDPTAAIRHVPMSRCASTGSLTSRSSLTNSQTTVSIPISSQTTHIIPSSSQMPLGTPAARRSLMSQPNGFPGSSFPTSEKPPALCTTLPKTQQFPLVQFGRLSSNFPDSPIFSPTSTTSPASRLFPPTSHDTVSSQLNPATTYSPTNPCIFPVGSSSAQTNGGSLSNKSHVGRSRLVGLHSPRLQHQFNICNNNQSLMETSGPGKQPIKRPTSQSLNNNSLISAQQAMNDKIAIATTMITSHPTFQSHVAAVVSSLVSNNSSAGFPQSLSQGVNYNHFRLPVPLLYMPSGLGPLNISSSPLNSQLANSLSTSPFPYHVAEAPLFPTSQNGDRSK